MHFSCLLDDIITLREAGKRYPVVSETSLDLWYHFVASLIRKAPQRPWHTGWSVCWMIWIYLTYPSGKERTESICKSGEGNLEGDLANFVFITFKQTNWNFHCQFSQVATAEGFLSVRGATLTTCHRPVASDDALQCSWTKPLPNRVRNEMKRCYPKRKKPSVPFFCSSFNVTVPFASDITAATAAPMLISLTLARLTVTSCFLCLCLGLSQLFLPGSNTTRSKLICYTMLDRLKTLWIGVWQEKCVGSQSWNRSDPAAVKSYTTAGKISLSKRERVHWCLEIIMLTVISTDFVLL